MTQFTNSFTDTETMMRLTASALLEIEAVHVNAEAPFKLTSGLVSPVYVDCRKVIAYPRVRAMLMDFACATLLDHVGFEQFDAVAGGETAGIPFAAWIAERLGLPMVYVRKKPKGFGRNAQIEGNLEPGSRVLLVEDLTTDGGSKITFAEALRKAEAEVAHTLVVFYYDIFPEVVEKLKDAGLTLHYLATWAAILKHCRVHKSFPESTLDQVEAFLNDPLTWSAAHGGRADLSI